MKKHLEFIERLVANGGPEPSGYDEFTEWIQVIWQEMNNGKLTKEDINTIRKSFGEALSILTLQGFAYEKPHGYPGDYEILDKIYMKYTSKDPDIRKWDLYFQLQKAPIAVRNRKDYFIQMLRYIEQEETAKGPVDILNIASGPCRDLFEYLNEKNDGRIQFVNVEFDPLAISYAKNLCKEYLDRIKFIHTNAFEVSSDKNFRLIWSSGLFDYLNEKKFAYLLQRIASLAQKNGEVVVGNFSKNNPTQPYMEIAGNWVLKHRSPEDLIQIAENCGFSRADIRVGQEPEGVNLFLHIKFGEKFILPDFNQ